MAPALQLGRMDVPPEIDADFNTWYNTIYIPNYEKVPGVIRGRRFRAVTGTPTYLTFYEFQNPKVSESPAWAAQRDIAPETQRIRPHMRHAAGSPGVYVKTFQLYVDATREAEPCDSTANWSSARDAPRPAAVPPGPAA